MGKIEPLDLPQPHNKSAELIFISLFTFLLILSKSKDRRNDFLIVNDLPHL